VPVNEFDLTGRLFSATARLDSLANRVRHIADSVYRPRPSPVESVTGSRDEPPSLISAVEQIERVGEALAEQIARLEPLA